MKVTYFTEILSSWCYWSEPTWAELKKRYGGTVEFEWKIALMKSEDFPISREQCDWFYRRSGTIVRSPFKLNSGWFDAGIKGHYEIPNYIAEAGKDFGVKDDTLRLALTKAALREGRKIGGWNEALAVAAETLKIDGEKIRARAQSPEVIARVDASTAEFHAHKITQRPAYLLEDAIGDKAVFSGLVKLEPLAATIDAMLSDTAAYATHREHFGTPPTS